MAFQFPDPAVTSEFEAANGITYLWDPVNNRWMVKSNGGDAPYVSKVGGDSMEGPLKVTGDRNADPDTGVQSSVKVLNVDSGQNSSLQLKFNGATKVYVGDEQTSYQHHIKLNGEGKQVYAGDDTDKKGLAFSSDGVEYFGDYTEDKHVATKLNVEEAIYHDVLDPDTNKYVDRSGDIMDGDLALEDSRLVFRNPVGSRTLIRANREAGVRPKLLELPHNGSGDIAGGYDIHLTGNTAYNSLRFSGGDTYMEIFAGGGAPQKIKFYTDISMGHNKISKLGQAVDDEDAVTYGQVKEELEELRDKIVGEVSIGTWKFDNISSGVTPLAGCFITKKDSNPPQLSPNDINIIRISDEDVNGNPGVFDWEIGDLLTFTNVTNSTQSIKFRVNSAPANSGSYWIVSVAHLTSNYDFFQNAEYYLSHINIDVSVDVNALDDTYLRLDCANDPLETELHIQTPDFGEAALSLIGKRDNTNNATATVAFKSQFDTNENYAGYLTYRTTGKANDGFFRFNRDLDLASNGLDRLSFARFNDNAIIYHNNNERISFKGANNASAGSGLVQFERPTSDSRRGVTIRGKNTDNEEDDLLYTYTFTVGGDAIGYKGRILNDNHITNKKYVDDAVTAVYGNLPYTIDAEDDTHWGDHRLEDVGHPVAATDATTKGYVDDKIKELLAKIEELEMTGGGTTKNYQFKIYNNFGGGSSDIGSQMRTNQIMSNSSSSGWGGYNTSSLDLKAKGIYLCLEEGYQLNSGRMIISQVSEYNNNTYSMDHKTAMAVISDVEKAPSEESRGKNIYKANVHLDALLNGYNNNIFPSWNDNTYLYITFTDGAITETSSALTTPTAIEPGNHITASDMQLVFEGLRNAVASSSDFTDMREKLALKISELEYSEEFQPLETESTDESDSETESSGY